MAEALFRHVHNGLILAPESDPTFFEGYRVGEIVKGNIRQTKGRSLAFLRKFMALIRAGYRYTDHSMPFDGFRYWMTIKAGFFCVAPDGALIALSIAFAKMSPSDFEKLYNRTFDYMMLHVIPDNVSREDLDWAVNNILHGFG